jgi:hypothetical protein
MQARVLTPPMFIEHEPQMPSRQERRNVSVGSTSFFILISASSTMGPHLQVSVHKKHSCLMDADGNGNLHHSCHWSRYTHESSSRPTRN